MDRIGLPGALDSRALLAFLIGDRAGRLAGGLTGRLALAASFAFFLIQGSLCQCDDVFLLHFSPPSMVVPMRISIQISSTTINRESLSFICQRQQNYYIW